MRKIKEFFVGMYYWTLINKWRLLIMVLCYTAAIQVIPIVGSRYSFALTILATTVGVTIIRITNK